MGESQATPVYRPERLIAARRSAVCFAAAVELFTLSLLMSPFRPHKPTAAKEEAEVDDTYVHCGCGFELEGGMEMKGVVCASGRME